MTHTHAKNLGQRSVGRKPDRKRTDGHDRLHYLSANAVCKRQQAETYTDLLLQCFDFTLVADVLFTLLCFDSDAVCFRYLQLFLHFLLSAQRLRYLLLNAIGHSILSLYMHTPD